MGGADARRHDGLKGEADGELEGSRAAGAEETAGGADRGEKVRVDISGVGTLRQDRNIASGVRGIGKAANVDAVKEVESFGHQVEVIALLDGDGFNQAQIDGVERAAEIDSVRDIVQGAAGIARSGRRARGQGVPFVDSTIELRAVLHAATQ